MRFIPGLFLIITLIGCRSSAEKEAKRLMDSIYQADSVHAAVYKAKTERLADVRDSLIDAHFEFVNDREYIHKTWKDIYWRDRNGFVITVGAEGSFSYLSTLTDQSPGEGGHDQLLITAGKESTLLFFANSSFERQDIYNPREGSIQVEFLDYKGEAPALFLSNHRNQEIRLSPMWHEKAITTYLFSDEDKQAIEDCMLLSNVLTELTSITY